MTSALVVKDDSSFEVIEQVVMQGDLSKLSAAQRVAYYKKVCDSCGLNPYTRPFDYIILNGKLTLYAKKDATEQLRKLNGISIESLEQKFVDDLYIVTAVAADKTGRKDQATGAVAIGHLKGEAKANAIMKAETKAKRRVTLSISGMGWTDESEIESIPSAKQVDVDISTGEIIATSAIPAPSAPVAKISPAQASELQMILDECPIAFEKWLRENLQKQFGSDELAGIPASKFEQIKQLAVKEMLEYHTKQQAGVISGQSAGAADEDSDSI